VTQTDDREERIVITYNGEINRLDHMIEDLRAMRDRTCEPKNNRNVRYHALSSAISQMSRAADNMRAEDAAP
jgi:hypothetical protein